MKHEIIEYLKEQIYYHEDTIASEDFDTEDARNAKKDIEELRKYINWIKKI